MAKNQNTFEKRRREEEKKLKAAEKRGKRRQKKDQSLDRSQVKDADDASASNESSA
jgi:hypothetical protein